MGNTELLKRVAITAIVGAFFVYGAVAISNALNKNLDREQIKRVVEKIIEEKEIIIYKPECKQSFNGYQELLNKGQYLKIVANRYSYAQNGIFINSIDSIISRTGSGEIGCGYLYIKVSKNNKPINNEWDSVYIDPHDFGGHILRDKSILHENKENYTEALLSLDSISYLPGLPYNSNAQNFRIADWVKLLNVNNHFKFDIGLSVENKGGLINEIIIAYKCWNPETGEETQNCQLSLEK
ncbi:MAG: hypothetical protein KJ674_03305 [Nanoarchaeota archaeon]|nr:hypothetical protein [Nanoarchaeota archaeon]